MEIKRRRRETAIAEGKKPLTTRGLGERRKLPQRGLRRNPRNRRDFERFRDNSSTDISSTDISSTDISSNTVYQGIQDSYTSNVCFRKSLFSSILLLTL